MWSWIGDVVEQTSKVIEDAGETAVQATGVGKMFETVGIKVDPHIHENGLHVDAGGLTKALTLGTVTDATFSLKGKSSGGDIGVTTSGEVDGPAGLKAKAEAGIDSAGVYGSAVAGFMVESAFVQVPHSFDINEAIMSIVLNVLGKEHTLQFDKVLKAATKGLDISHMITTVLFHGLKMSPFADVLDGVKKAIDHKEADFYLKIGCAATVGVGITLKIGMEEEVDIAGNKQKFHMFEIGGSLAIEGVEGGIGLSAHGKTYNGFDKAVYVKFAFSADAVSASGGFIMFFNLK